MSRLGARGPGRCGSWSPIRKKFPILHVKVGCTGPEQLEAITEMRILCMIASQGMQVSDSACQIGHACPNCFSHGLGAPLALQSM
jgi:hypothetical protein